MINQYDHIEELDAGAPMLSQTPGQLLREQREARSLSVQQVADELHLTMHFIRALESDAYDKLPGDVFARGYLRSYASLLQLDPDQMMQSFNGYVIAKENRQQADRNKRAAKRRKDKNLPWIVFSGIAFITVAIVLWFFSARVVTDENLSKAAAPVAATRMPLPSPAGTAVPRQQFPQSPAVAQAADVSDIDSLNSPDQADSAIAGEGAAELITQIDSAGSSVGRLITIKSGGDDLVRIALSGQSWVAVDDNSNEQIFRDLLASGDVLELHGTIPVSVLLGDAAVVQVFLNGQQIDIASHIRQDNSARFTLGL